MADKIKIEIISDVVCPWCIIGYKRLEKAISEMDIQDRVEIDWEPFELNPHMGNEGEEIHEHMHNKYGTTRQDSTHSLGKLTSHGAEDGFRFDFFEGMRMVNTRDAHILLEYAKNHGKQTEFKLNLFKAFFTERQDVSDRATLKQALAETGLDPDEGLKILSSPKARDHLHDRESHWLNLGVTSVPTMIFNGSSAISGARNVETYKQILTGLTEHKTAQAIL